VVAAVTYAAGAIITFDNGGTVRIDWIDESRIGYTVTFPDGNVGLFKKTPADFADSIEFTRAKIARGEP
jgi:hypothetical protein